MRKYTGLVLFMAVLGGIDTGCTPSTSTPSTQPPGISAPVVPKKNDADNPLVKEARPDAEAILNGLVAGKYDKDPNLYPVARKVQGFQSWAIETQESVPDLPKAVRFGGTLRGPTGEATFSLLMVKQQNGRWMVGEFSGPSPK